MTWGLDAPYEEPDPLDDLATVLKRVVELVGAKGPGAAGAVHLSVTKDGVRLSLGGRPPIDADAVLPPGEAANAVRAGLEANGRHLADRLEAEARARPLSETLTLVLVRPSPGFQEVLRLLRLQAVGKSRDAAVGKLFDAGIEELAERPAFKASPASDDVRLEQVYLSSDRYERLRTLRPKANKADTMRLVLEAGYARLAASGHPLVPKDRQPGIKKALAPLPRTKGTREAPAEH